LVSSTLDEISPLVLEFLWLLALPVFTLSGSFLGVIIDVVCLCGAIITNFAKISTPGFGSQ
jgi:hypothetical protein